MSATPLLRPAMVAVLVVVTVVGSLTFALITQPAAQTQTAATPEATAVDTGTPLTQEDVSRAAFATEIINTIPASFTGTLISIDNTMAVIEYKETSAATHGTENVNRATYVVTYLAESSVIEGDRASYTPGTAVSVSMDVSAPDAYGEVTRTVVTLSRI